jgi:acyl transferase domain-containing protein
VLAKDIAYTRAAAREKLPHRAYAILESGGNFSHLSASVKAPVASPALYIIFSGQGAQWPEMGRQLIETDPCFRDDLARMDQILQGLRDPPSWSILGR